MVSKATQFKTKDVMNPDKKSFIPIYSFSNYFIKKIAWPGLAGAQSNFKF